MLGDVRSMDNQLAHVLKVFDDFAKWHKHRSPSRFFHSIVGVPWWGETLLSTDKRQLVRSTVN